MKFLRNSNSVFKGTDCHLSGTPVGFKMLQLKSMEIKSNAEVSFTGQEGF